MFFKQFYLNCLAHASYLIGSDGVAAVVDPQRDVDQYIETAKNHGFEIKHIIETHFHADFVSGHVELAQKTGAKIYFGQKADAAFEFVGVRDGDEIAFGSASLKFMETPGHTPESICILVTDRDASSQKLLTGDTLFIGDVGRPDLVGAKGFSTSEMAGMLYDSLHQKILKLPDAVEVFPAHGAGSACGKNISSETSSTLGKQRKLNYALQPMTKEKFVEMMTKDIPPPPPYFPHDAEMNRSGAAPLSELPDLRKLRTDEAVAEINKGAIVLDTRDSERFGAGHFPGSVNVGLNGQFASWVGTLFDAKRPIILVTENDSALNETQTRLARVGVENVVGYLKEPSYPARTPQISVNELHQWIEDKKDVQIVDVRRPGEFSDGRVPGGKNLPLAEFAGSNIETQLKQLDPERPTAVICAGGYRSSIATSLLESKNFKNLYNVTGGFSAWRKAGYDALT